LKQHYPKEIQPVSGPEKAFGQALREVRKARKMSQEQLAFDSEFDRTYISLVERGIRSPTIRSVVRLAEVLEVKPSEIVSRMEVLLRTLKRQRRNSG
jgi:transcriptional regulator with XRE-family HTH domain